MSRSQERFQPRHRDGRTVKVFTCGPSIYRRPHIGNYRTFLYEDLLVRYLAYQGYRVQRVINFTDVEDKTIEESLKRKQSLEKITGEVAGHFYRETALLNIMLPEKIPSSSTSVDQAVKMIERLMRLGYAYRYGDDIFFDPLKKKDFGKLFRLDMSSWPRRKVRFKKDTYEGRRWNRGDFILWHGEGDGSAAAWETAIGRGRPAWNIQDPAMITQHLGDQVDINCGGIDNIYRHHDYNIAVMEAYTGKPFANYFLHGEHLVVNGKSMSKSRGNILYPDDILKKGYKPCHLRFFLIHSHYRRKLNYTEERFRAEAERLDAFLDLARSLTARSSEGRAADALLKLIDRIPIEFETRMNDDLNAGSAFEAVHGLLQKVARLEGGGPLAGIAARKLKAALKRIDSVLGLME